MNCFNIEDGAFKVARRSRFMPVILLGFSTLLFTTASSAAELVVNGGFEEPDLTTFPAGSKAKEKGWTTFYGQNYRPEICTNNAWERECNDDILVPGWSMWWTDTVLMMDPATGELVDNPAPDEPGRLEIQNNELADRLNPKIMATNAIIEAANLALPPDDPNIQATFPLVSYAKEGAQKAELDSHFRIDPATGAELINHNVSMAQTLLTCIGHPYTLTYNWRSRTTIPGDNDVRVVVADVIVRENTLTADWVTETVHFTAKSPDTFLAFISIGDGTTKGMSLDGVSVLGVIPDPITGDCPPPPSECESCDSVPVVDGVEWVDPATCEACIPWVPEYSRSGKKILNGCGLCEQEDKPTHLTMVYDGDDFTSHGQEAFPDKYAIIPEVVGTFPVRANIQVREGDENGDVLFAGEVYVGEKFTFERTTNEPFIMISDADTGALLQTVLFHASCSKPLEVMDSFGGVTVWEGTY